MPRPSGDYVGPLNAPAASHRPDWPAGDQRLFLYLNGGYKPLERLLTELGQLDLAVIAHLRDVPARLASRKWAGNIHISGEPVDLAYIGDTAHAFCSHGGHGTTTALIGAGLPGLLLPQHVEQLMMAVRLVKQKLALAVDIGKQDADYGKLLRRLVSEPEFSRQARGFSRTHGKPPDRRSAMVSDLLRIAHGTRRG